MKFEKMFRIVIKVGSHVLSENNSLALDRIANLTTLLAELIDKGNEVILVSSGAVAAGYTKLQLDRSIVVNKQAIAALGQPYLMSVYKKKMHLHGMEAAQVLVNAHDFDSRRRTQHAKDVVNILVQNRVLPIINENDATTIDELVFGDNDQLSAHVAFHFNADILVILSDIDSYYDSDPNENSDAKKIKYVKFIDPLDLDVCHTPNNDFATGGIVTKLKAADFLLSHDKKMFLASGFDLADVRSFLLNDNHRGGTLFSKEES